MHVHPEVWLPNQANLYKTYVEDKGTVVMNPNGVTAFQGICVSRYTADTLGVSKITDLTDPAVAAQFDTNGDGKGEVWIGATGPGHPPTSKKFAQKAMDMTRRWN